MFHNCVELPDGILHHPVGSSFHGCCGNCLNKRFTFIPKLQHDLKICTEFPCICRPCQPRDFLVISHPGWRFAVNKKLRWKGQSGIFLAWLGNSFEIPNRPTWPPKMFWLPQVTLKHLVGTYIFITQFVKSFPHRKTLNLPDVLSPSPETSLASLEIISSFGKLKRMPFIYTNSMRNSVSLEIISKFAKLKQKIDEFENNLQFRQSPISPNSIGSLASLGIISNFSKLMTSLRINFLRVWR